MISWVQVIFGVIIWIWFMWSSLGCLPQRPSPVPDRPTPWCFRAIYQGDLIAPCFEDLATCTKWQAQALGTDLPGVKVDACVDVTAKLPSE